VSKKYNCHCAGTTKVAAKVVDRNTWRGKLWGDLGNRHKWCGRHMFGQTVSSTGSSNS